jgi:hypothetical protein
LKFNPNKEITVHNVKIMPQNLDKPHDPKKWKIPLKVEEISTKKQNFA